METTTDYAKPDELAAFWRPLADDEGARAASLLKMASNYLRQIATNNGIDLDTKISEDTSGLLHESVKMVVLGAVKRAMVTPSDLPPVDSWSQSASPYSETMKFTNPTQDLFFKRNELSLIGLSSVSGRSKFGLVRGVRGSND